MSARNTPLFLARGLLSLAGGLIGYGLAALLLSRGLLTGPNNLLFLTLLGFLLAYLLGGALARRLAEVSRIWITRLSSTPPEAVLAAGTGATVALLVTVLLNNLLASVPGFTWYWSLLIALVLVLSSGWFFVANRRLFAFTRGVAPLGVRPSGLVRDKLIDTSAIIDGRVVEVVDANFVEGALLVPNFVLSELQHIADSADPLRRQRGRRGLEVLDRLSQLQGTRTEVIQDDPGGSLPVDEKLVRVCQQRGADLITTDYNLSRVAGLQGVRVLNLNQLANSVKAMFLPGERLSLSIVRPGREAGQGLAYLEDGTMVVVEDAAELVGLTIVAVVTSSLQTNMGRMIFARQETASGDPSAHPHDLRQEVVRERSVSVTDAEHDA